MNKLPIKLLLADDDKDDCDLFRDALSELPVTVNLATVHDGEQLMQMLTTQKEPLPQLLFLDLNMPRKNGFECLAEIKKNEHLSKHPIIIFSTSFDRDIVNLLYKNGANYYICKPNEFDKLKILIQRALDSVMQGGFAKPAPDNFVIVA